MSYIKEPVTFFDDNLVNVAWRQLLIGNKSFYIRCYKLTIAGYVCFERFSKIKSLFRFLQSVDCCRYTYIIVP